MRNLWQKFLLERKKNGQIKKMVSIRRLILSYTMQRVIPNICAKFQNLRCSSFWEIFDTNFPMYYIGVRDGKMQKRRQKLTSASWFSFPQYTWHHSQGVYKIWRLSFIEAEKFVTEIFIGEKEKWTNNGNDKQEEADSLLHNTTSYTQHLYLISNPRFSSSWEIFDEKESLHTIGYMISTIIIRIFVKDKMTKTGTADLLKCTSKIYF